MDLPPGQQVQWIDDFAARSSAGLKLTTCRTDDDLPGESNHVVIVPTVVAMRGTPIHIGHPIYNSQQPIVDRLGLPLIRRPPYAGGGEVDRNFHFIPVCGGTVTSALRRARRHRASSAAATSRKSKCPPPPPPPAEARSPAAAIDAS
eukprot:262356-Pyramimonas_sp.AAC.1